MYVFQEEKAFLSFSVSTVFINLLKTKRNLLYVTN